MGSGGVAVRTEGCAVAASGGDVRRGERGDFVVVPGVGGHVAEAGVGAGVEVEGAGEEHGHLVAGDGAVGTEAGAVAASCGDAQVGHPLDEGAVEAAGVHVGEPAVCGLSGVLAVEGSHNPHGHGLAVDGLAGAQHGLGALGAVEHAVGGQRAHRLAVEGVL